MVGIASFNHTISFKGHRPDWLEHLARVRAKCPEDVVQAHVGSQKI